MAEDLQITKSEFTEILKNRGKQVSSGTDDDTLLKKVNYLKKQDLVHLATIRGLVFSESSLVNILHVLFKDVHKKKQSKLINDLYKHYHKKKQIKLSDDLQKHFHKKKQSKLINDLYKYHHIQKAKNIKGEICRNLQKRQNKQIIDDLRKLKRLKKIVILLKKRIYLKKI